MSHKPSIIVEIEKRRKTATDARKRIEQLEDFWYSEQESQAILRQEEMLIDSIIFPEKTPSRGYGESQSQRIKRPKTYHSKCKTKVESKTQNERGRRATEAELARRKSSKRKK